MLLIDSEGLWHWVEHISWLVGVVGFPLAGYAAWDQMRQVRVEQERILHELGSRANVFMGFRPVAARHKSIEAMHHAGHSRTMPELPQETRATVRFSGDSAKSDPLEVGVYTYNHGPRTAHNLLWNVIVPRGIDCARLQHSHVEYSTDPDGCTRIIRRSENLHPEVVFRESLKVKVPRGMDSFEISVTLSLEDVPTRKFKLLVNLSAADAAPVPDTAASVAGQPPANRQIKGRPERLPAGVNNE